MSTILNYEKWKMLKEQKNQVNEQAEFTQYKSKLFTKPVCDALVKYYQANEWTTNGYAVIAEAPLKLFKLNDACNKNGKIFAIEYNNVPFENLDINSIMIYLDKTDFTRSQLVDSTTTHIHAKMLSDGVEGQGAPISKFVASGSWADTALGGKVDAIYNRYGLCSRFLDYTPESVAKLYSGFDASTKDHFKKQVEAVSKAGFMDKNIAWLNDYKAKAAAILPKLV